MLAAQPGEAVSPLVRKLAHRQEPTAASTAATAAPAAGPPPSADEEAQLRLLRNKIHENLIAELDLSAAGKSDESESQIRQATEGVMARVLADTSLPLQTKKKEQLIEDVLNEAMPNRFGPLEPLLRNPAISEIVVNCCSEVFVEQKGRLDPAQVNGRPVRFDDDSHLRRIIDKILAPIGRRVNERTPMADGRLPDGSRVNVAIPPVALKGSSLTIRKFSDKPLTVEDLIGWGTLTQEMRDFLEACVHARLNIIIAGGTGSGKTSSLNVMAAFIPMHERVVTVEDSAELRLPQPDLVTLEARPPNIEGEGQITIRDLVRNCLRMRPDRIVVGEVRGGECLDMLQAMNTGHDGSLATCHSNSPRDTVSRLETMTLMSGMDLPIHVISKQIASAVQLIVQQSRLSDGSRKIINITEVQGMEGETVLLQDIFVFEQRGIDGEGKVQGQHRPTGFRPRCMDLLIQAGCKLPPSTFM